MLQRSPTYIVAWPDEDRIANALARVLPRRWAYRLTRWKNIRFQQAVYARTRTQPDKIRKVLLDAVRTALGPDYDVDTHFTPRYNPWDQRLCLVPNGDLFNAIRSGKASMVTDQIETFTETGIALRSGAHLDADIIVTATGLKLQLLSDIEFAIDGKPRSLAGALSYKAMMFGDVPNLSYTFGYTNASWTLKADLTAAYLCRLLRHMDEKGFDIAVPRTDPAVETLPFLDFTSGYVQRSLDRFPKQGSKAPWRLYQNYAIDAFSLRYGAIEDGAIEFAG